MDMDFSPMFKQEQYKNLFKFGLGLLILGTQIAVWAFVWMSEYAKDITQSFVFKGNILVVAVYGILAAFFTNLYGGYRIGYYRRADVILSGIIAIFFTNIITYLQTCLVGRGLINLWPFVWMTVIDTVIFYAWAIWANRVYNHFFPPHKILMVYNGNELATMLVRKMAEREEKYRICEAISVDAGGEAIAARIDEFSAVILCDLPAKLRNQLIKRCFEKNIRIYTTPKISDILIRSAEDITLFDTPLLLNRNRGLSLEQRFIKRGMDIIFSALGLIFSSPLLLLTAVLIKLQDHGPVIFKQERATMSGRAFNVYKFRSMIVDAEKDGKSKPAVNGDPRITPFGDFIRKTRLDELPQLWNILIGDMSIVGPRPERMEHVQKYTEQMPEFSYRLKVRAGLTGYAQVIGKYNTTAYDKLKMDLMYITNYSLIQDLKIIMVTVKILFTKSSTEGWTEN